MNDSTIKSIIIISGPPGAGKSTVSKELIKLLVEPVVCIEGDKFWSFFAKGFKEEDNKKNFKTMSKAIIAAAIPYALEGNSVIIDFTITPKFLAVVKYMLESRHIPIDYVLILPKIEICAVRAKERGYGIIEDYQRYENFYNRFVGLEKNTINNEKIDLTKLAKQIKEGLDEGEFRIDYSHIE